MSQEATCRACAHWNSEFDGFSYGPEGELVAPFPQGDTPRWGTCQLIALPDYGEQVTVTAYTKDGSNYRADLHTRDDFGCTLWAEKEAK